MMRGVLALAVAAALLAAGCDNPKEGRKTAAKIEDAIGNVCGTTEHEGSGGPRTITPIDLDGADGPSGFLVTCLNGKVEYVEATS